MTINEHQAKALNMVKAQRKHQDEKFGWIDSDSPDSCLPKGDEANERKLAVILEELGEVAEVINDWRHTGWLDRAGLHHELAQTAACCVAWIEADLEVGRPFEPEPAPGTEVGKSVATK